MLKKYAPQLWILGGFLLMLPSILGNDRTELVPIGIVFMVIGITSIKKKAEQAIYQLCIIGFAADCLPLSHPIQIAPFSCSLNL